MSFTMLKLMAPSPPTLPAVPSLAELQKHAESLTAALPSYSSFVTPAAADSNSKGQVDLATAGLAQDQGQVKSKPIPMVTIHSTSNPSGPGNQNVVSQGGGDDRSWLAGVVLGPWGSASAGSSSEIPPPSYKARDPTAIALTQKQLREEMQSDRARAQTAPGLGRQDEDQGRAGLLGMQKGWFGVGVKKGVIQGGIPGDGIAVGGDRRTDRWGREMGRKSE